MFGFFKEKKAISDAEKLITDLTKRIVVYDPKIKPSELFLEDPYVLGYIKALSEISIMFNYKYRPNHIVSGKILCKSIQNAYPKQSDIIIEKLGDFNMSKNEKFMEGLKLGIDYGKSLLSNVNNSRFSIEETFNEQEQILGIIRNYIRENYVKAA